jgi:mycofactocin system glycosyltransferase
MSYDRAGGGVPAGMRLTLAPGTRRFAPGLVGGGSPWRLLRLSAAGDRLVERWSVGEPVPDTPAARHLATRLVDGGLAWSRPAPDHTRPVRVVIPCRDRAAGLAVTLEALDPELDVVVVDDASNDPAATARLVAGRPRTRLYRRPRRGGPAAARNDGWREAGAGSDRRPAGAGTAGATPVDGDGDDTLVAFVDTECIPPPGWCAALAGHFGDPSMGAVAPRITAYAPGGTTGWLPAYEQARSPLDLGPWPAPVRPATAVSYVPSTALVVRRAALDDLGGFDDGLVTGEDVDLVWRLDQAGWRVRYDPSVVVGHPVRPNLSAWLGQRVSYGRSAAPLAARHGRKVAPLSISRWSAAVWALACAGHPLVAMAVAGASSRRAARRADRVTTPGAPAVPRAEIARLVARGHLLAGRGLADAVRRTWWPLAAVAAVGSRRCRRALAVAVTVPPLIEWVQRRPPVGPLAWMLLRLADDAAYGAGVWAGAVGERRFACLLPSLS